MDFLNHTSLILYMGQTNFGSGSKRARRGTEKEKKSWSGPGSATRRNQLRKREKNNTDAAIVRPMISASETFSWYSFRLILGAGCRDIDV